MRIGIDCRTVLDPERGRSAGIAHYTDALVRALVEEGTSDRFVLFFDKHARPAVRRDLAERPNVEVRVFPFHAIFGRLPLVQSHMVTSALFSRSKLDLLHGPANVVPLFYSGPFVVTVHDLAIYEHPEWFPSPFPGAQTFSKRLVVPRSLERAKRIIAVSRHTAEAVLMDFEVDEKVIDVIPEAVTIETDVGGMDFPGHDKVLADHGLGRGNYVLSVGTVEPRKNLARAARAFSSFLRSTHPRHDGLRYVIAGKRGWKWRETVAAVREENDRIAQETGVERAVRLIGPVDAVEKRALFAHAAAVLFPSLHEGFGLPVLEGFAAGAPVITGNVAALPEIAGDAAVLVDPANEDAIAGALAKVIDDEGFSARLREKGRVRAGSFTWKGTALSTLHSYRKALGKA